MISHIELIWLEVDEKDLYYRFRYILNIHYEKPICIPIYHNQQAGKLFKLRTSTMTFQIDATYETSLV